MNPTRGNNSPKWNSTFATTRRAVFQLAAWYSTDRPVPLTEGVVDRNGTYQYLDANGQQGQQQLLEPRAIQVRRDKPSAQDLLVPLVRKLVAAGEKVLIFRNARGPAQGCAAYLAKDLGLSPAVDAAALLRGIVRKDEHPAYILAFLAPLVLKFRYPCIEWSMLKRIDP